MNEDFHARIARLEAKHGLTQPDIATPEPTPVIAAPAEPAPQRIDLAPRGSGSAMTRLILGIGVALLIPAMITIGAFTYVGVAYEGKDVATALSENLTLTRLGTALGNGEGGRDGLITIHLD